ncbi:MAG: biotin--[acetyl-CoA-carboxylase] ligase [Christensenellales bacterium]
MKFVPLNQTRLQEMTGAEVVVLDTVTSTNDYIEGLLRDQFVEGLLVVAEEQTAGKGRIEGRRFFSPAGYGIYMSMAVKVGCSMEQAGLITPAVAVAVARAVEKVCGISLQIKWVNDLYLSGKKVGGIMCNARADSDSVDSVIVGIGVNAQQPDLPIPDDLVDKIAYLYDDNDLDRNVLIAEIYREVMAIAEELTCADFLSEYKQRSMLIGNYVDFVFNGNACHGKVLDIDDRASLVVDCGDCVLSLNSGEVTLHDNVIGK